MEDISEKDVEIAEEIYDKLKLYSEFHGLNLLTEKNIPDLIRLTKHNIN